MTLYLDNSVLNRPFDDQNQPRIWLETQAFILILTLIERAECALIRSRIHDLENERNPDPQRKAWVTRCLLMASHQHVLTEAERERANELVAAGLKPLDSLHLACAEYSSAGAFLTCDDRLIRRYIGIGKMQVQTPTAFIESLRKI